MSTETKSIIFAIIFLFGFVTVSNTQTNEKLLKYGLEFGIKKKEAKKILEAAGYGKVEDVPDSKEIDNIIVGGSVIDGLDAETEVLTESELEFYDDRLMSTKVSYELNDVFMQKRLETKYLEVLIGYYGEPQSKDSVMGITSWIWERGEYRVLLNSDSRKKEVDISYMYLPIVAKKYEDELKVKLKGKPPDVAKETFLK